MNATALVKTGATELGFFNSPVRPAAPHPMHYTVPWKGKRAFLRALAKVENSFRRGEPGGIWCQTSAVRLATDGKASGVNDPCYFCGEHYDAPLLTASFRFADGRYEWSDLLGHYVKEHNLPLPADFVGRVLTLAANGWQPRRRKRPEPAKPAADAPTNVQEVLQVYQRFLLATLPVQQGGTSAAEGRQRIRAARAAFEADWAKLGLPALDWDWDIMIR